MGHKKLKRFEEIKSFGNVFQYPEGMKGQWVKFFGNNHPITLELACGKGEYTIGLAEKYPNRNFIGIDLKGNRIWKGASIAIENKMKNVAFMRSQIELIENYFDQNEIDEIWITFPDPQLRHSKAKKRLSHPRFLLEYEKILRPGGAINLKTDSPDLYHFTKEVIEWCGLILQEDIADIYTQPEIADDLKIKTYYETLNISGSDKIFYLRWVLPKEWNRNVNAFKHYYKEKYIVNE